MNSSRELERERNHDHERERDPPTEVETPHDRVSLYVIEEGSQELLNAIYDADTVAIPTVGDRISFTTAAVEGNLSDRAIDYWEVDHSATYVVEQRDITYLHVDYDVKDVQRDQDLISEVRVWVTEIDKNAL